MSLKLKISEDLKTAMKEKNTIRLSVLRVLKGEIERNEQSSKGKIELADIDIIKIIKKLADGVMETGGSQHELNMLECYMPKQMSEVEIKEAILTLKDELGVSDKSAMGKLIGGFNSKYPGMADGKLVSNIVKEMLN